MAEAVKKGIESEGGHATILQVAETLPEDVLAKMHAPPKPAYPIASPADLLEYDAYLFGISTRYGGFPAQFKAFFDASGQLWQAGQLWGKFAGAFVSTGGPGGGQESTYFSILTTLVHHGLMSMSRVISTPMLSGTRISQKSEEDLRLEQARLRYVMFNHCHGPETDLRKG